LNSRPGELEFKMVGIRRFEREREALERDSRADAEIDPGKLSELEKRIADEKEECQKLETRWKTEREAAERVVSLRERIQEGKSEEDSATLKLELQEATAQLEKVRSGDSLISLEVNPDVIAKVVADWTGIPVGKMIKDEART